MIQKQNNTLGQSARSKLLRTAVAAAAGVVAGGRVVDWWRASPRNAPIRPSHAGAVAAQPITITTEAGLRVHAIQTGFVAIKSAHHRLRGPEALRFLTIIQDSTWTAALPILTWVIEHPEGVIVIDTGESAQSANMAEYMACDRASRWFFERNLRLFVTPDEEIGAQLRALGIALESVRWVVMTHLHSDHAAGMDVFSNAEVLIARQEFEGHKRQPVGAVPCLWPADFRPRLVDYTGPAVASFPATLPLTRDGAVTLLPTPGHSYGHQSVLLRDTARSYLFAGDVAFSERQLLAQEIQGICQDVRQSRRSLTRIRDLVQQSPTVFLPSHDPESLLRLKQGQTVHLL
jgi:glyoxylase-like metal-dependent hydrolase (beta-lactamase superfamily II)